MDIAFARSVAYRIVRCDFLFSCVDRGKQRRFSDFACSSDMLERRVPAPALGECLRKVVQRSGVLAIQHDRSLVSALCVPSMSSSILCVAQPQPDHRMVGPYLRGGFVVREHGRRLSSRFERGICRNPALRIRILRHLTGAKQHNGPQPAVFPGLPEPGEAQGQPLLRTRTEEDAIRCHPHHDCVVPHRESREAQVLQHQDGATRTQLRGNRAQRGIEDVRQPFVPARGGNEIGLQAAPAFGDVNEGGKGFRSGTDAG